MLRKLSSTLKVTLALFLAVFSNGMLPAATAYGTGGPNEDCSVGLSLVAKYEWNKDTETYDYEKGLSENAVSVSGDSESGSFTVASGYTVSEVIVKGGQGTVAGTTNGTSGTFSNVGLPEAGNSGKPAEISNLQFCGSVVIPQDAAAVITVTPPTCDADGTASVTTLVNATLVGTLDITVGAHEAEFVAESGHHFANGTANLTIPYTILAQKTGEECEEPNEPTPTALPMGIADVCGTANDTVPLTGANYSVETDSGWVKIGDGPKYERTITYVTAAGYIFMNGEGWIISQDGTEATYTFTDWGTACPETPYECPANTEWFDVNQDSKKSADECFKKVWVCKYVGIPGVNERLKQGNDGLVQVSVNAIENNRWDGTIPGWFSDAQDRSYVLEYVDDKKDPPSVSQCPAHAPDEVTPEAPAAYDLCYTDLDVVYVGSTEGIVYKVNGEEASNEPIFFHGDPITVTAHATEGNVIKDGEATSWTFDAGDFTNKQCLSITKTAKNVSDTNLDGKIGVGDIVTWEITVTNTSDFALEGFYVEVDDATAVLEDEGYIEYLGAGDSTTLSATSTLTAAHLQACKITNTASFNAWRSFREVERAMIAVEEPAPVASGNASAEYKIDCPETGQVLSSTTTKTQVLAASVTPEVLPATGGASFLSQWFPMIAAVLTYGITSFAQSRKQRA